MQKPCESQPCQGQIVWEIINHLQSQFDTFILETPGEGRRSRRIEFLSFSPSNAGNKLYRTGRYRASERSNEGRIALRAEITEIENPFPRTSENNMQINYIVAMSERQWHMWARISTWKQPASPGSNLFKCDSGTHDDRAQMRTGIWIPTKKMEGWCFVGCPWADAWFMC